MNIFPSIESCCNKPVRKLVVFFILFTTPFLFSARTIRTYDIGIIAGTLIDGNGGAPQTNRLILINDGKIVAIVDAGRKAKFKYKSLIDAHDKFIIPGLIEMHGHVTMTYRETALEKQSASGFQMTVNYDRPAAEWMLKTLLDYGITPLRETGRFFRRRFEIKTRHRSKTYTRPLYVYLRPFIRISPSMFKQMSVFIDNETEARREVQRQVEAGVDFIKVYGSLRPELTRVGD
jgi:imidazolonepropionase-like amidohydrolase